MHYDFYVLANFCLPNLNVLDSIVFLANNPFEIKKKEVKKVILCAIF